MTDKELIARLKVWGKAGIHTIATAADRIETLLNEAALNKAAYDGLASLLLSVQQDCIKERQRADLMEEEMEMWKGRAIQLMEGPNPNYKLEDFK